jgi:hypothetical protein
MLIWWRRDRVPGEPDGASHRHAPMPRARARYAFSHRTYLADWGAPFAGWGALSEG